MEEDTGRMIEKDGSLGAHNFTLPQALVKTILSQSQELGKEENH